MNSQDQDDNFDQQKLSALRKQVTLSKSQLLQLAYDDCNSLFHLEKFLTKLQYFNNMGYQAILQDNFHQAIIFLNQAENILQYAASCGKTIERNLIITTLQNEACVYHRTWQLQKAINYIQAIIYNISSFLQGQKGIQLNAKSFEINSQECIKTSIYLKNKLQLVFYHLQFCAVSSQNQNHENALVAASKALKLMKEICGEQYALEIMGVKNDLLTVNGQDQKMLLQLENIRQFGVDVRTQSMEQTIDKFLKKAKRTICTFRHRVVENMIKNQQIKKELHNYSIGFVMQINPRKVTQQTELLDLKQQFTHLKKIYKAIYISICHFTLATQLRLISSEKFTLDINQKRNSIEFKTSQIHHLISIITAGLYIPCETVYFQHIINSFKNHYQLDLTQQTQLSLSSDSSYHEQDNLVHLQTSTFSLKKQNQHTTQFLPANQLKPSIRNSVERNLQMVIGETHSKTKKNLSKKKLTSMHASQKSLKANSTHQTHIPTSINLNTERNKSKSKGTIMKKSNMKEQLKSKKKSKKNIQHFSPSAHKKPQEQTNRKKKSLYMKTSQRSKSKTKRNLGKSRNQLEESKQKMANSLHYYTTNTVSHASSKKHIKTERHNQTNQKHQKTSHYIRNNLQVGHEKKLKKEIPGSGVGDKATQKLATLRKNKSPGLSEKESRSTKRVK